MEYFVYKGEDELTHWGVRGMRWGIRRYQNKDGSLTKAGQKRYNDELAKVRAEEKTLKNRKSVQNKMDKLAARKKAVEEEKKQFDNEQKNKRSEKKAKHDEAKAAKKEAKKSIKEMGDEELAYKIRRTQMEKQYESLIAEPEPVAKGNGFVKDFMNKSAVPAIQEAGKALIRDSLLKVGKKYLGLEAEKTVDTVSKLKEEYEKLNYEDKIKNLKNKAEKAAEKERSKQAEKERAKAEKQNRNDTKSDESSEKKVYTGEVSGLGTSTRSEGKKWTTNGTVYDAEYTDVVNNNNTSSGRSYVSNYLSAPAPILGLPARRNRDDD